MLCVLDSFVVKNVGTVYHWSLGKCLAALQPVFSLILLYFCHGGFKYLPIPKNGNLDSTSVYYSKFSISWTHLLSIMLVLFTTGPQVKGGHYSCLYFQIFPSSIACFDSPEVFNLKLVN